MYRILIAVILLLGMTQQAFAYTLTTRDERTVDRLINRYELMIDREGDDIRPNILAQLERKLARFQRIGAYRLSAIYQLVINELTDVTPPVTPTPPVIPTTFEVSTTNGGVRYLRSGDATKVGSIRVASYNGTTEPTTINLLRTGYGSARNIESVWLEYNGVRVTTQASINSDNHVILSFIGDERNIYSGNSKTFDLVIQPKNPAFFEEHSTYSFFTTKECMTINASTVSAYYFCGDNANAMQFIGGVMVQISRPTPITATYRLVVDGMEKSRFSSITRSSADYYCQRDRSKYQDTTIECVWNDITIYKEEAIKRLYKGYLNEKIFITTESITKSEALKNCLLNSNNNPQSSIRCVWNDSEIYSRKAPNPPVVKISQPI